MVANELSHALEQSPGLRRFDLTLSQVTDVGIKILAIALEKLDSVSFFKCGVEDSMVQDLAIFLKDNDVLNTLNLGENMVGDVGVKTIVDALQGNTKLEYIVLNGNNNITTQGQDEIKALLEGNPNIVYIGLDIDTGLVREDPKSPETDTQNSELDESKLASSNNGESDSSHWLIKFILEHPYLSTVIVVNGVIACYYGLPFIKEWSETLLGSFTEHPYDCI